MVWKTDSERVAQLKSEGERFVPEGTGPKVYVVTCKNKSDWDEIHNYIINENEIDGIPNRKIECTDECKSCDRMASYEMSDEEANQLKLHPKVAGVNVDPDYYQGTFKGFADKVTSTNRYGTNVKIGRDFSSSFFPSVPDSSLLSRTGASIYRHSQLNDPWNGSADSTILDANPQYIGDGTDVDVIVCDESGWYGHVEFVKTGTGEPTNFVGENVLKSGFAASATTGLCGVLDCVLDLPYYLDPDFFEDDAGNRLEKRWDGTTVPVESVARAWWNNSIIGYRSAKYIPPASGGTATGDNDFGTVSVSSSYTRANSNGSNTTQHAGGGYHATPCMSQAYGKTQGWAFNANKWHMSIIWSTGALSIDSCFKILKIFHQVKPNRSSDNTKNPTITSHSWGRSRNLSNGYYYFRTAGDGTGGVNYSSSSKPAFLNNLYSSNRHSSFSDPSYSQSVLGKNLVDAGVIFVAAAGNDNQKMVLDGHPDYNNYDSYGSSTTLASALIGDYYGRTDMTNRHGFPADIGFDNSSGTDIFRSFNIGALDSNKIINTQERKASYSNMGNGIDCYAIGADSLSAVDDETIYSFYRENRYDSTYRIDNYQIVASGGTLSDDSQDREFGGTSSACPVACGLMATKLQYNRTWTWSNLKDWLANNVTDQSTSAFYEGTEATTATDTNWNDDYNLQGSLRKIIWDASTTEPVPQNKLEISGNLVIDGVIIS